MRGILWRAGFSRYGFLRAGDKLRRAAATAVITAAATFSVASAQAEPVRIAALGDSLTQGYGLAQADGFVPQLQAWLDARGHEVVVINAGVSGDTTAGGRSRLDWTLADGPDAVIVALGGNDLLRGIDPAVSRANLEAILQRLQAEGLPALLVGLPAPGNYGPDFATAFEAMYPELAAAYDAGLVVDMLGPISEKHQTGQAFMDLMQGDGIHPNAAGVSLIVDAMGPAVEALIARVEPRS
jgi:acyl-CoA thioesterase I